MRKIVLLLMLCCCMAASAQQEKTAVYKGFLLEGGNSVYISCMSIPKNAEYNEAAVDVLTRQVGNDGFWRIAERPEDAHFAIVCQVNPHGGKTAIAISSDITACMEKLGSMKCPEDVTEFRKIVWELYKKYITPLQRKIKKNAVPKHTLKIFTVE